MNLPNTRGQGGVSSRQDKLENIVYVVVIVLLIGLASVLVGAGAILESWLASKQATYEDLKDQVIRQNDSINTLINEVNQLIQEASSTKDI